MSSNSPSQNNDERKRIHRACQPCKIRKRRCDGKEPCSVCTRLEDDCFYEKPQRKQRKKTHVAAPSASRIVQSTIPPTPLQGPSPESLQANSADALASRIDERLKHDTTTGAKNISTWNLGISQTPTNPHSPTAANGTSIDSLLRYSELRALSATFFSTFSPLWPFLLETTYYAALNSRTWLVSYDAADPILFGVALIGSYFSASGPNDLQARLYDALDTQLARYGTADAPSFEIATALLLKNRYLHLTGSAYATWRVSCECISVLETLPKSTPCPAFVDRERLHVAAYMAHIGVSSESGRPSMRASYTDLLASYSFDSWELFRLSAVHWRLPSSDAEITPSKLEDAIREVFEMNIEADAARLSQANMAFAFFRRLRFATENVPLATLMQVIDIGTVGMAAARRLVERREPWWHLLNVPFQFICTILVIDCPVSLGRVRDALRTLKAVAGAWPGEASETVLERAVKMVTLIRKRKMDEWGILDRSLAADETEVAAANGGLGPDHVGHPELAWGNLDWFTFDDSMLPLLDFDLDVPVLTHEIDACR